MDTRINIPNSSQQTVGNIFKYYLYIALSGLAFGLPTGIWVIYLVDGRGLSLAEVTVIEAIFWIVITVSEVPTGIVADVFGRKLSLICGVALVALSMAIWSIASTIPLLILTYVVWGVGSTFRSGAQEALLYESVKAEGLEERYAQINGRSASLESSAYAFGIVMSGFFAAINLVLPIIIATVLFVILLGVTLTFEEPVSKSSSSSTARKAYKDIVRDSITLIRNRATLRYAVFYMTIIPMAFFIVRIYFLQPQSLALGVPLVAIGVVGLGVQAANIMGLTWTQKIADIFGTERVLYLVPVLLILALGILGIMQSLFALFVIAFMGFLTGIITPTILSLIQNQVDDEIRATVLSMQSLATTGVQVVAVPTLGIVAAHTGFSAVYWCIAGLLALFFLYLYLTGRQHFPYQHQK